MEAPPYEPTPKDVVLRDGTARLYRFRSSAGAPAEGAGAVLVVPSLINRWYVLDLRESATVLGSLVEAGLDTYCLDWGVPRDEDRYLTWDDVLRRLHRAVRHVRRCAGVERVGLLGYCMGATLSAIHTALFPETIASLANLAGPIDFAHAGVLGEMVSEAWFDVDAVADAGNAGAGQMQSGFLALRPTSQIAKWVTFADRATDPAFRRAFAALDGWANDNVAFPAAAYRTYIRDLYQKNLLVKGRHGALGRPRRAGRHHLPSPDDLCDAGSHLPAARGGGARRSMRVGADGAYRGGGRTRGSGGWPPGLRDALPATDEVVCRDSVTRGCAILLRRAR